MPLHELGYRAWQGRLEPERRRWWVIAQSGSRLAWRSRWLRRLMLIARLSNSAVNLDREIPRG